MAKCIGAIHKGVEYDPNNLPEEVKKEIQNKLSAVAKEVLRREEQ